MIISTINSFMLRLQPCTLYKMDSGLIILKIISGTIIFFNFIISHKVFFSCFYSCFKHALCNKYVWAWVSHFKVSSGWTLSRTVSWGLQQPRSPLSCSRQKTLIDDPTGLSYTLYFICYFSYFIFKNNNYLKF